ncbi:MAG: phosphopantothenate/pantothenate synthetase [Thermoplasmata archaeon]|nr:phosphopantothenate/pantothenate synthetase [Thermoplasmata archaeon]
MRISRSHPRYRSLKTRERLVRSIEKGLVVKEGLIAHGRGEAFDYLLGEKTIPPAEKAEKAAVAYLLKAKRPVISINGNSAALASKQIVGLGEAVNAMLEANVFYGDREKRIGLIVKELKKNGAREVLGPKSDARIPRLMGQRALCSSKGIFASDVVLVPLEDGDRTLCLARMDKVVITIDLNPLSRTSMGADVSIVDELTRAITNMTKHAKKLAGDTKAINRTIKGFDNKKNLSSVLDYVGKRLAGRR